jgi:hypothetical protein
MPIRGVAIRTDGKKWDLDRPVRAEILRQAGLSGRRIAEDHLDMPESSYREEKKRSEEREFSLRKFTPYDLDFIVRGEKRGRRKSS